MNLPDSTLLCSTSGLYHTNLCKQLPQLSSDKPDNDFVFRVNQLSEWKKQMSGVQFWRWFQLEVITANGNELIVCIVKFCRLTSISMDCGCWCTAKFLGRARQTALWSHVCIVVVGVQEPPPSGWLTPPPPSHDQVMVGALGPRILVHLSDKKKCEHTRHSVNSWPVA